MDEKNLNQNGFEPNENQTGSPNGQQGSEQGSQSSGWVFSDKNVSDQQKETTQENSFFHKDTAEKPSEEQAQSTPNEQGWYRSGSNSADRQSAYNSKYSYQTNPTEQGYAGAKRTGNAGQTERKL